MAPQTIIFMGPQGSGKGTQVKKLHAFLVSTDADRETKVIETGDRFRALMNDQGTFTGRKVKETMDAGILQPVFLTVTLWGGELARLGDSDSHMLIDGFPRRVVEAEVLNTAFEFYEREDVSVIFINVSKEVTRERMRLRGRHDDTDTSIAERLNTYREETLPVVEYYKKRLGTNFVEIDGAQIVEEVHVAIRDALRLEG